MSFLRKGLLVSSAQIAVSGLNVVTGILYARKLGPDGMGRLELLRSTATIGITLAALGLGNASIFFINNRQVPVTTIASQTLKAGLVLSTVLAAALAFLLLVSPIYFGTITATMAVLFGVGVGCQLCTLLLRPILVAQMQARRIAALDLVLPSGVLAGGSILALLGRLEWEAAVIVLCISMVSSCAVVLRFLWDELDLSVPFNWALLKGLLAYGVKLAAANILLVFSLNITVMLLRYLSLGDFTAVGLYTRAIGICALVTLVPAAVGPLLYAKWSGAAGADRRRQVELALRMNSTYGLAAAFFLIAFGSFLIQIMYGRQFLGAYDALQLLAPAVFLMALFNPLANLLSGDGRAAVVAWVLGGTVIIVGAVTALLVPSLGIRGAAVGAACGNTFAVAATLLVCRHLYGIDLARCLLVRREDVTYIRRSLLPARSRAAADGQCIATDEIAVTPGERGG